MKRKFIITAEMRDLEKQVNLAEISYGRMIEILCEKADEYAKPEWIDIKEKDLSHLKEGDGANRLLAAGWISVKEKLPQHENNVLAVLDGQVCIMNYFSFQENGETNKVWGYVYDGINGDGIFDDNYYPTHWMEIPCPPAFR